MNDCKDCEYINTCRSGSRRTCAADETETRYFNFGLLKYENVNGGKKK